MTNLPFIHYSNPRFQNGKEEIVYGANSSSEVLKSLSWNYSDRLIDWSYKMRQEPGESDIDYWEKVLKAALNKPVKIECVIGGCNSSNGWGYYVFGYKEVTDNGSSSN